MIIDGNKIAKELEDKLITKLLFSTPKKVCFVLFGGNAATEQFVKVKSGAAERLSISVDVLRFSNIKTTEDAVLEIHKLNKLNYDGIVVQLPLVKELNTREILDAVSVTKDVDVLSTQAKEMYANGQLNFIPPVAAAVKEILDFYEVNLKDKNIVIVGSGLLVGEPVHLMLEKLRVPHKMINIKTSEAERLHYLKTADIIISGTGVSHGIQPEMIKEGVILIDAGTSEQGGKLVGDIDPLCESKATLMTPAPGGVGPVTVASLFGNLF